MIRYFGPKNTKLKMQANSHVHKVMYMSCTYNIPVYKIHICTFHIYIYMYVYIIYIHNIPSGSSLVSSYAVVTPLKD